MEFHVAAFYCSVLVTRLASSAFEDREQCLYNSQTVTKTNMVGTYLEI